MHQGKRSLFGFWGGVLIGLLLMAPTVVSADRDGQDHRGRSQQSRQVSPTRVPVMASPTVNAAHGDHGRGRERDRGRDAEDDERDGRKASVCHATGSSTNPFVLITVSENALRAHLAHGDALGDSSTDCAGTGGSATAVPPTATEAPLTPALLPPSATPPPATETPVPLATTPSSPDATPTPTTATETPASATPTPTAAIPAPTQEPLIETPTPIPPTATEVPVISPTPTAPSASSDGGGSSTLGSARIADTQTLVLGSHTDNEDYPAVVVLTALLISGGLSVARGLSRIWS
jgi:hypothetical protein